MTDKEMQRFLVRELDRGCTELEAYRNLMSILDIHLPPQEDDADEQEKD